MENSIKIMMNRINEILFNNEVSAMLFGSVVLNDFKLGWSDIDFICLTQKAISNNQADELVTLRQTLMAEHEGNPYFRLFEGGILTQNAFMSNADDTVIYWGTSGQRKMSNFQLDPFAKIELHDKGRLLCGNDFKKQMALPTRQEIIEAIYNHYNTIRTYGQTTSESAKSGGWFLDIARCLYTLRTNAVIAKTDAGEWAINENLCPDIDIMKRVLEIRKNPLAYIDDEATKKWGATLGIYLQRFADVLECELRAL